MELVSFASDFRKNTLHFPEVLFIRPKKLNKLWVSIPVPGVILFESRKKGPRRLHSAGVHGDETEGQFALNTIVQNLIRGELTFSTGSLLIIFGNIPAMKAGRRFTENGCDLNRLFQQKSHDHGCYEFSRMQQLTTYLNSYMPHEHLDWHSTIRPTPTPFALCSWQRGVAPRRDTQKIGRCYGITTFVRFPIPAQRVLHTFSGFTVQRFAAYATTIELGAMKSRLAQKTADRIIHGMTCELSEMPFNANALEATIWRMGRKISKTTRAFTFTRELANFDELREGEVFATDGDIQHTARLGDHILFPNPKVRLNYRAAVIIRKRRTRKI